jgi:hypothetical protein
MEPAPASGKLDVGVSFADSGNRNCEGARLEGNFEACVVAEPARRSGNRASEACTRQTHDPGNWKMGA